MMRFADFTSLQSVGVNKLMIIFTIKENSKQRVCMLVKNEQAEILLTALQQELHPEKGT